MRRSTRSAAWAVVALVVIVAALMAAACQPVTPQGAPATAAPAAALPLPDPATDWSQVQAAGQLVVGTSAGYPPFEFYNDSFVIDGFDIALMRAIGQELGVEVVFKNIAFDGLFDALALGQIDAAIAAITETPARAAILDFSSPYFASSEGYLVASDAAIESVDALAAITGLRVGVQRGSIYESWIQSNLVDSGQLDPKNLLRYLSVEAAVEDLVQGKSDVVVSDLPTAEAFARQADVKVVGQGLFNQVYGIALRKDSALKAPINQALASVQKQGVIPQLAAQYLGLDKDQLQPVPADEIVPAQAPPAPACRNGAAVLEDLSYPDAEMTTPPVFVPGQPFSKSWRIQNTGTCTWDESYSLAFAYGNAPGASMGGAPVAIQGQVAPGATYDIAVDLVAPIAAGLFQGFWQLEDGNQHPFGESLRVGIHVAGAPTPTPMPTQTPVPGITFYADAELIQQGDAVTLFWDVQDAKAVYAYRAGEEWQDKAVEPTGSAVDYPATRTTYNLRVVRNSGEEILREVTVAVEPRPDLPQIAYFTADPDALAPGQCLELAWQVTGEAATIAIFRDDQVLVDNAPVEGTLEDCPPAAGEYAYAIGAAGVNGGVNYDAISVVVSDEPAPKGAAATTAPAGPTIDLFAVQPAAVAVNGCVTLNWQVSGDTANIRIQRDDVVLLDGAERTGTGSDCLTTAGEYLYTIAASNEDGQTADATATVTVSDATPTPAPQAGAAPAPSDLAGKELIAISYRDASGAMASPLSGAPITAVFSADGDLNGNAGCNNYMTTFVAGDGNITITPPAATFMFCGEPAGVMDQEAYYLSALTTAATYAFDGDQLVIADGAGNQVAVFVAQQ